MNMLLSIILMGVVSLTLGQSCSESPDPNDAELNLTADSDELARELNALQRRNRMNLTPRSSNYVTQLNRRDTCPEPEFPDDDPNNDPEVARLEKVTRVESFVQYVSRTCEPCPVKASFLGRFYGNCYVIAPQMQQVRFVTCPRRCMAPCMCSRSYCRRTHWIRVWFFSYCFGSGSYPGGFQSGLNFRYQWLPQDCSCVNV